ncbi:MAG: helix-turn-helix domain-containing protein [Pseudomonadota bacterium]
MGRPQYRKSVLGAKHKQKIHCPGYFGLAQQTRPAKTGYRRGALYQMNAADTMKPMGNTKPMGKKTRTSDWAKHDAMSDEDKRLAALSDPDAHPMSDEAMQRMQRTPQAKIIRRALRLTQEEFAAQFQISIGTLRDWEQNRYEPDGAAKAYLKVIAKDPDAVRRALEQA